MTTTLGLYGLMAEFDSPTELVRAAGRAHEEGFRKMDAYSPIPIEELHHAMHMHRSRLPLIVLIGGILGCIGGFYMQYWYAVDYYPINSGGKPLNSWPMWMPVTFELTVLAAALSAVFGMLALNGLPMPYHPVFNAPGFALASKDRFFLCIETADPKFDRDKTAEFLRSLNPREVVEVAH